MEKRKKKKKEKKRKKEKKKKKRVLDESKYLNKYFFSCLHYHQLVGCQAQVVQPFPIGFRFGVIRSRHQTFLCSIGPIITTSV
ncbi:hypothetical protein CROQUDRAFT_416974 [Cronartium quercuum f. sp. fusiforme G11]|uniref:Uncharacterized protein n=1 Tax=Cronartium quercuum f. sp. fusiforme G11 TaxID=708437 RepID=A0A9P6NQE3_9BASI|nr:hypothetical protein CROQUDRAFT_416974 [Cronartium quercuum f. sp. fusiforme G11]